MVEILLRHSGPILSTAVAELMKGVERTYTRFYS